MWVLYSRLVALVVNLVLLFFLIVFVINGLDIINQLHVTEDEAVSGKFQDFNQYQNMSDLDRKEAFSGSRGQMHQNDMSGQQYSNE